LLRRKAGRRNQYFKTPKFYESKEKVQLKKKKKKTILESLSSTTSTHAKNAKTHFLLLYPKEEKKRTKRKRRHEEVAEKKRKEISLLQGQPAITMIFLDQMNLLVLSNVHPTDITGLCLSSTSSLPIQSFLLHPLGLESLSKRLFAISLRHGAGGRGPDGGAGISVLVGVVDAET
jgi:hypothetical protein